MFGASSELMLALKCWSEVLRLKIRCVLLDVFVDVFSCLRLIGKKGHGPWMREGSVIFSVMQEARHRE